MNAERITPEKLEEFLTRHDLTNEQFANILGVTKPAIDHWLTDRRRVPPTTVKLIKLFDKYPKLMKEI